VKINEKNVKTVLKNRLNRELKLARPEMYLLGYKEATNDIFWELFEINKTNGGEING